MLPEFTCTIVKKSVSVFVLEPNKKSVLSWPQSVQESNVTIAIFSRCLNNNLFNVGRVSLSFVTSQPYVTINKKENKKYSVKWPKCNFLFRYRDIRRLPSKISANDSKLSPSTISTFCACLAATQITFHHGGGTACCWQKDTCKV